MTTAPTMAAMTREGVYLRNGHPLFPTFTTANASAMATGHMLGDTGDFSNTIYTGFAVPAAAGSSTPFIENDQTLADIDEHFAGNYLNEATILKLARDAGFSTAAGFVGPNERVDHDISLLIPELWCRLTPTERSPAFLIGEGHLEPLRDFEHAGRKVLASRLGYRITAKFVRTFLGRVFDHPDRVFDEAFLRPETAQGIFVNFKNVVDSSRVRIPFGIAQAGKSFRNEITPRNFTFRSREFEQMEIEFFCHPDRSEEWYRYWRYRRYNWYLGLGLARERLRLRDHEASELAH